MNWISQNIGNIIVGLIILAVIFAAIRYLKKNKSPCPGCTVENCPYRKGKMKMDESCKKAK